MEKQFTCPVSMAVTEEQFNKDLRQPLEELGYSIEVEYFGDFKRRYILVNNINNENGQLGNLSNFKHDYNRHFIDHYNPKLFLALASMTDSVDGNIGEWWKCIKIINGATFQKQKLYKQVSEKINNWCALIDDVGTADGNSDRNKEHFVKATKEEIIAFFTETKEEVLARFEKGVERELIGYRFRNNYYNAMTYSLMNSEYGLYEEMKSNLKCNIIRTDDTIINKLTELNLLEIFCEPIYKEIETISITEAEKELKRFGREVKIDKDLK